MMIQIVVVLNMVSGGTDDSVMLSSASDPLPFSDL